MGFGWDDALDGIKGLGHAAGGLSDGVAHLGAEGLHAVGLDSVANVVDGYGSSMNFVLSSAGDLAEPLLNAIPQVISYDANFIGEGAQLFNDWAHGDPDAWSNFADAHVAMTEKAWDDFAGGWTDAWKDITGPVSDKLFKEMNQIDPANPDNWGQVGDGWGKLLTGATGSITGALGLGGIFGSGTIGGGIGGLGGGIGSVLGGGLGGVGSTIGGILGGGSGHGGSGGSGGGPVQQGMNRDAVQQLVEVLRGDRETLVRILADARHVVARLGNAWEGSDSERYAANFATQAQRVDQCIHSIEQMTKSLTDQLQQQQSTSAV